MSNSDALVLTNVDADYGRGPVLRSVSMVVAKGSAIGVLGANGAGKTTLARTIAGIIRPTSGRIVYDDHDVTSVSAARRARRGIALVPEGRMVFPDLSVHENLTLGAVGAGISRRRMDVDPIYATFPELKALRNRRAGMLSGGEQQMVAIGRALVAQPQVIVLDEPSLGLSPLLVERMYAALRDLVKEFILTLLVIEQNTAVALAFCDHTYVLRNGAVVAEGSSDELANPDTLARLYLG